MEEKGIGDSSHTLSSPAEEFFSFLSLLFPPSLVFPAHGMHVMPWGRKRSLYRAWKKKGPFPCNICYVPYVCAAIMQCILVYPNMINATFIQYMVSNICPEWTLFPFYGNFDKYRERKILVSPCIFSLSLSVPYLKGFRRQFMVRALFAHSTTHCLPLQKWKKILT